MPATRKKGISGLGWLGIGCGALLVLVLAAVVFGFFLLAPKLGDFAANPEKAAAEFVLSMNPALEKISQDEKAGTMTIRTQDGEQVTLSYKDIAEGKISFKDKDGNLIKLGSSDLSQVPGWVPKPSDLENGMSLFHAEGPSEVKGQFTGKTSMTGEEVVRFYENALNFGTASGGYKAMNGIAVTTKDFSQDKRKLSLIVTEQPGQSTQLHVNYQEMK